MALARSALDPLAVLASLCGSSAEILGANLHPLQGLLPKQDLLAVAERICITATNQVLLIKVNMHCKPYKSVVICRSLVICVQLIYGYCSHLLRRIGNPD